MTERLSLRWKLIVVSGCVASFATLILGAVLHQRTQQRLLQQLESTLESKCDEVVTVLQNPAPDLTLIELLAIETEYRSPAASYFYQIRDTRGQTLVRSVNLGAADLPMPESVNREGPVRQVHYLSAQHPLAPGDSIRIRSERVQVAWAGDESAELVIQVAGSMAPFNAALRATTLSTTLLALGVLAAVFALLWFVITRALEPVAAMTRTARQITANNLKERLPVRGAGDELDELAVVLNDGLDRLGVSLRQMEQFSSDAAHQLRTPLTRIRGNLDLVLHGDLSHSQRSDLERVLADVERLSRVCGKLLLLANLDQKAAGSSLLNEQIDLDDVVAELLEQMTPLARDRGVELRRGKSSTACIRGSRPLVVEALLNLLDNAIRFTPAGDAVVVSVETHDGLVHVAVEGGGPGVAPEERERVFQRFYRIPRPEASAASDGSGLGLAIVKAIALAHRGRAEIVGPAGTAFQLVFPAAPG